MSFDDLRKIADDFESIAKTASKHSSRGGMLRDDTLDLVDDLNTTTARLRGAIAAALEDYARAYSGRAKREDAA